MADSADASANDQFPEVKTKIIQLCSEQKTTLTSNKILEECPGLLQEDLVKVINSLLKTGQIEMVRKGKELTYKLKSTAIKGDDVEEKVVYGIIEEAGSKGIWIRDIRFKTNIQQLPKLNKILKSLEGKKLIKSIKSVSATKKKVYMLYDLDPDRSLTGGVWFSDTDFESEFVDVLNQQCFRFLQQKHEASKACLSGPIAALNISSATSEQILDFISKLGISKIQLSLSDIEMILDTLMYDGKVEKTVSPDPRDPDVLVKHYRVISSLVEPPGLLFTPCGFCPVIRDCTKSGVINPSKCVYMNDWLSY